MGNAYSDVHVVVVGFGYAGTAAAKELDGKCRVTVIEPSDAFHHKISALRGAVVPGWEKRVRVPTDKFLKHAKIVRSNVKSVETGRVTLEDDTVILCDYIILAHGYGRMFFPSDVTDDAEDTAGYMAKLRSKQKVISQAQSVLIVGGGPVGVELAGEIAAQYPGKKITLVHSGATLLNNQAKPMVEKARQKVEQRLATMGIEVRTKVRVTNLPEAPNGDGFVHDASMQPSTYQLSDGSRVSADLAVNCTGATRRRGNLVSQVDASNRVMVEADLQVCGLPRVYCAGDANNVADTKMGYFAGKQAVLAARNVLLAHAGRPTEAYVPMDGQKEYGVMLVPLGPQRGVVGMGGMVLGDRTAALLKGKGLMTKRIFAQFNASLPPL